MYLNTLKPAPGSKRDTKCLGRGIGSGLGKTSGRGHKGQHARAGGFHKLGFEGGQSPLQRRLPKFGFRPPVPSNDLCVLRLDVLNPLEASVIDLAVLREAGLIKAGIKEVKLLASGSLKKAVRTKGLKASKGARVLIEAAGGCVEP